MQVALDYKKWQKFENAKIACENSDNAVSDHFTQVGKMINTGNEINNHKLDMENDKKLVDAYKEEKELLTSNEIKEIRNMYGMTQKEYAFALGMGEISIHRLEKTFI